MELHRRLRAVLVLGLVLSLSACAYPTRTAKLGSDTTSTPYRWSALAPDQEPGTLVVFTASGGGTRATALAAAALNTMNKIKLPSGRSLAQEVDIVSSVSGGSVTAAYFAMYGVD